MATVSGNVGLNCNLLQVTTGTLPGSTGAQYPASPTASPITYTNGTGAANTCDLIHAKTYTLASTTTNLNLQSLLDPNGGAVNFARVREIIVNITGGTDTFVLLMGGAGTNEWNGPLTNGSKINIYPGAPFRLPAPMLTGITVGASNKQLLFDSGSHTIVFELILLGNST